MSQSEHLPSDIQGGFFKSLLSDASANTLAIGAAAMVPLVAMVGGGIDASRFYMAQSRLQAACDAGALAARRAVDTKFTSAEEKIGKDFFNENFESGMFGLEGGAPTFSATEDGEVLGSAKGTLPTSLMGMFGYDEFDVSVKCSADINISNTDIVFVVDVTGSMNCPEDTSSCSGGNNGNVEASNAKIKGLRTAVMTFYNTVEGATSSRAQVRYGMVPYASNVNVGAELVAANASWMADDAVFQSRWAKYKQDETWEPIDTIITEIDYDDDDFLDFQVWYDSDFYVYSEFDTVTVGNSSQCSALQPDDIPVFVFDELGFHQGQNSTRTEGNLRYIEYDDDNERVRRAQGFAEFYDGSCLYGHDYFEERADVTFEQVEELTLGDAVFDEWVYAKIDTASPPGASNPADSPAGWESVDIRTAYGSSRQVSVPINSNGTMQTLTWDGCIEEAETVATTSFDPVPTGALDLNINLVPSTQDEKWKPVINNIAWERRNSGNSAVTRDVPSSERSGQSRPSYSCPQAAFRLADLEDSTTASTDGVMRTKQDLQNYVNSLRGRSNTYHDIGMLWGARFVSPKGIFQSSNEAAPNGDAISRHIVFMTDGLLEPNREVYGTYGIERWSRRVSGDGESDTTKTAHRERLQATCQAARNENISVWVVAFGKSFVDSAGNPAVPANLEACATPGRAYVANDSAALEDAFKEIAEKIAALRLTA